MNAPVDGFNLPNILVPVSGLSLYEYAFAVEAIGKYQEYSTGPVDQEYDFTDDASFIIEAAEIIRGSVDDFVLLGFESDVISLLLRAVNAWKRERQERSVREDSEKINRLRELFDDMNWFSDSLSEFVVLLEQSDNEVKSAIYPYLKVYESYVKRFDQCCSEVQQLDKGREL